MSADHPILAHICREYKISETILRNRIRKEGWDEARQLAQIEGARDLRRVANLAIRVLGPEVREHLQERMKQIRQVNGALLDEVLRGLGLGVQLEPREDEITQTTNADGSVTKKAILRRARPGPDPHLTTSLLRMELEVLLALADGEEIQAEDSDMGQPDDPAGHVSSRPTTIQIH